MASMNAPNLTGVAQIDLGLGGDLKAQVDDEIKKRRKKGVLAAGQIGTGNSGMNLIAQVAPGAV